MKVKYGYAITCHKAQGGEWDTAIVNMDVSIGMLSDRFLRWAYTAVTRAEQKLYIFNLKKKTQFSKMVYSDHRLPVVTIPSSDKPIIYRYPENKGHSLKYFFLENEPLFLKDKFWELMARAEELEVTIIERLGNNFQEQYVFRKGYKLASLIFYYNGKDKFTKIMIKDGGQFDKDLSKILKEEFSIQRNIVFDEKMDMKKMENSNESKIDFKAHSELKVLYELLYPSLFELDILINEVQHWDYKEIYFFQRKREKAAIYFYYKQNYDFTYAGPVLENCNSNVLLGDLARIILELKKH